MKDLWLTNSNELPDLHRQRLFVGESGSVLWATLWACQSENLRTRGSIFEHIWRWLLTYNFWSKLDFLPEESLCGQDKCTMDLYM